MTVTEVLEGVVALAVCRDDGVLNSKAALSAKLARLGAKIANRMTKDVTHIIFQKSQPQGLTLRKKQAEEAELRAWLDRAAPVHAYVLSPLWVEECAKQQRRAMEKTFILSRSKEPVLSLKLNATPGLTGSGKKRKAQCLTPRPADEFDVDLADPLFSSSQQIAGTPIQRITRGSRPGKNGSKRKAPSRAAAATRRTRAKASQVEVADPFELPFDTQEAAAVLLTEMALGSGPNPPVKGTHKQQPPAKTASTKARCKAGVGKGVAAALAKRQRTSKQAGQVGSAACSNATGAPLAHEAQASPHGQQQQQRQRQKAASRQSSKPFAAPRNVATGAAMAVTAARPPAFTRRSRFAAEQGAKFVLPKQEGGQHPAEAPSDLAESLPQQLAKVDEDENIAMADDAVIDNCQDEAEGDDKQPGSNKSEGADGGCQRDEARRVLSPANRLPVAVPRISKRQLVKQQERPFNLQKVTPANWQPKPTPIVKAQAGAAAIPIPLCVRVASPWTSPAVPSQATSSQGLPSAPEPPSATQAAERASMPPPPAARRPAGHSATPRQAPSALPSIGEGGTPLCQGAPTPAAGVPGVPTPWTAVRPWDLSKPRLCTAARPKTATTGRRQSASSIGNADPVGTDAQQPSPAATPVSPTSPEDEQTAAAEGPKSGCLAMSSGVLLSSISLLSGLSSVEPEVMELVKSAARRLRGLRLCSEGQEGHATHLIIGQDRRTLKVLLAVLNGARLLTPAWVTASLDAGRWLPGQPFLAKVRFAAAAEKARQGKGEAGLLQGRKVYIHAPGAGGRSGGGSSGMLRKLVLALSGKVAAARGCTLCLVAGGSEARPSGLPQGVPTVREEWLLHGVEHCQLPRLIKPWTL